MYVIFRSPVNLFKTVLSILYVLMDGLVVFVMCIVFHFTSCACSVHLHYLEFSVIALIWYTPYACVEFLELLVLLNSQCIYHV